eukprot:759669-Amphidinium_carterae.1
MAWSLKHLSERLSPAQGPKGEPLSNQLLAYAGPCRKIILTQLCQGRYAPFEHIVGHSMSDALWAPKSLATYLEACVDCEISVEVISDGCWETLMLSLLPD